jgi:hypothetical protein
MSRRETQALLKDLRQMDRLNRRLIRDLSDLAKAYNALDPARRARVLRKLNTSITKPGQDSSQFDSRNSKL